MKFRMLTIFSLIALCAVFSAALSPWTESNGSFENGPNVGSGFMTIFAGQNNILDWTVGLHSVDYIGGYWQASEGVRSIDLNGHQAGEISQTIETAIGLTYRVTFDLSGNPDGLPTEKIMSVSANGANVTQYSYSIGQNTKTNMQWVPNEYHFVATNTNTVLAFTSHVGGFFGPAIDNVAVAAVSVHPFSWFSYSGLLLNQQALSQVTAGSDVPIRFTLDGNKGNPYSQPPTSQQINCATGAPIGVATVISRPLPDPSYSATFDFYQTTWHTLSAWKFTCRRLTLHLNDGTTKSLDFYFK